MQRLFVNTVKSVDKRTFGLIRWGWIRFLSALYWPELYLLRKKIRTSVGRQAYENAKLTSVALFPERLPKAHHIYRADYVIKILFLACDISPQSFNPTAPAQVILNWQDVTKETILFSHYIDESKRQKIEVSAGARVINESCTDISKKKIGELNTRIFGYELDIDPLSYIGQIVEKSDENGLHDGRVITAPVKRTDVKNACVYSVLIDNVLDGFAVDLRVIYMNGLLDIFYEKKRPVTDRFANANSAVSLRSVADEFSPSEAQNIALFCNELGADYVELDVLRDKGSQKIYIVDVARAPAGPPNGLSRRDRCKAIEHMSVGFIKNILTN